MAWQRSGPERVAAWLRFFIRAGFLVTGIVGSLLLMYVAINAGLLFVDVLERTIFRGY